MKFLRLYPAVVYIVGCEIFTGLPQELGAGRSLKLLCTLSNDQLHIKGLVGRQACKLSHDSPLVGEQSRGVSYKCARTCTKQNANIVFFSLFFPSQTLQLTHLVCTLSLTLFPRIPERGTAGTITDGGWGQTVFSTLQIPDRVSCSTNTTSPLFLRLLIPRIRRHG